ncbi:MAG: B12-binding domain-containing protein [Pikeienuella sp.]
MKSSTLQMSGSQHGSGSSVDAPSLSCTAPGLRLLIDAVESEVIPRLLLSRSRGEAAALRPGMTDIERLCGFALDRDTRSAIDYINQLVKSGVGQEAVYLDLLGPAARLLGEMWEQDRVSFVDVTVGLCTLHQILFRLAIEDDLANPDLPPHGAALFCPVPGETHVFGTLIVAKLFARAGWDCWTELNAPADEITALHTANRFDLIGFSMSCERHASSLRRLIAELRAVDAPRPKIIVGGTAFQRDPGLAEAVGADGLAEGPAEAIRLAETALDKAPSDDQ